MVGIDFLADGLNLEVGYAKLGKVKQGFGRKTQEDAGVECVGGGLAEGGKVFRPSGGQVWKRHDVLQYDLLPTLL